LLDTSVVLDEVVSVVVERVATSVVELWVVTVVRSPVVLEPPTASVAKGGEPSSPHPLALRHIHASSPSSLVR